MTTPLLQFIHADFQWEDEHKPIVKNCNWTLNEGEAVWLDEPSGKGKSTFLKLAAGLLKPTHGKILRNTKHVGFVFQDQRLLPWLTPKENIKIAMKSPDEELILNMLDKVGLGEKANQDTATLSGGEAQRINIIRALINAPKLLLLDEPFNGLDENNAKICSKFIQAWKNLSPNNAMILVSHNHFSQTQIQTQKIHFDQLFH